MLKHLILISFGFLSLISHADVTMEGNAALPRFLEPDIVDSYYLDNDTAVSVYVKPFVYSNENGALRLAISDRAKSTVYTIANTNLRMGPSISITQLRRCLLVSDGNDFKANAFIFSEVDFEKRTISLYLVKNPYEKIQNVDARAGRDMDSYCKNSLYITRDRPFTRINELIPDAKPFLILKR